MSYYDSEAKPLKAMEHANTAMCPYGGSVPEKDKDKQIALASGIMLAEAVGFGLLQIAEAIKALKGSE